MKVFAIISLAVLAAARPQGEQSSDDSSPDTCEAGFPNGNFTLSRNLDDWEFTPYSEELVPSGQYAGRPTYALEDDIYNTQTIQSLYIILPHNQGHQVTEFTTDVNVCPRERYSFDLNPFHDEGFTGYSPCTLTITFANQTVCNRESLSGFTRWNQARLDYPVSFAKEVLKRDLIVGPFSRRTPGVTRDCEGLSVPFKVKVECDGEATGPPWAKLRLANFAITKV